MPKAEPLRSCLGCREVKGKRDLFRYVLSPDRLVVPDPHSRLPGRGAYTCPNQSCLAAAVTRRQFSRAFKADVAGPTAVELEQQVRNLLEERIASYISLANKAGKVVSGTDMVVDSLRGRKSPGLVFLARDASEETLAKIESATGRAGVPVFRMFDKGRFGDLLGKEGFRSAVAILESGFIESVIKEIQLYRNFFEGGAQ